MGATQRFLRNVNVVYPFIDGFKNTREGGPFESKYVQGCTSKGFKYCPPPPPLCTQMCFLYKFDLCKFVWSRSIYQCQNQDRENDLLSEIK